jgi:hypothetical protein
MLVSTKDRYKKNIPGLKRRVASFEPDYLPYLPRHWLLWACFGLRWLLWAFVGPSFVVNGDGRGWRVMLQCWSCCGDDLMGVRSEIETRLVARLLVMTQIQTRIEYLLGL